MNLRALTYSLVVSSLSVLALAASGCGGDGNDESTEAALTKVVFVKRADSICDKTEKRQLLLVDKVQTEEAAEGQEGPPSHAAEVALVSSAGLPPLRTELKELSELPPPQSDAKQLHAYLAALGAGIKAVERNPEALLTRKPTDPFAKAASIANEFGFKVCSGA